MKYLFIAAVHYLKLENEEIKIPLQAGYLSNESNTLEMILSNNLSLHTLGLHSIDEIRDAPSYYVLEGDFSKEYDQSKIDAVGTSICFAFLRQIQAYVGSLWEICDNSIYVRDGFLYSYNEIISDGCTFKASVSTINSKATGAIESVSIPTSLLMEQGKIMEIFIKDNGFNEIGDYKTATQIQHYKKSGLSRKALASVYIALARGQASIPMKLLLYCSAAEARGKFRNRIKSSCRGANGLLLGNNTEERVDIYSNIKLGYDTRSKVAHGALIKKDETLIQRCSTNIDDYLRKALKLEVPFSLNDKDFEDFFLRKLMN